MAERFEAGSSTPPYDDSEPLGYPVRMGMQESLARIGALRAGLHSLMETEAPEPDAEQAANNRAFVQNLGLCSTLLVRRLAEYDDVAMPPGLNIAMRLRILQELYPQIPGLRTRPETIDTTKDVSREELAVAMRDCYAVHAEANRADDSIQRRLAGTTLGLWNDIARANPEGILVDAQADSWIHDMEIRRRDAFGPGSAQ